MFQNLEKKKAKIFKIIFPHFMLTKRGYKIKDKIGPY